MAQIHPSAVIHEDARLADDVTVGPYCVIGADVSIFYSQTADLGLGGQT